jgi:hypothetical protein
MTVSGWNQTQGKYNIGEDETINPIRLGLIDRPMNNDGIFTCLFV